MSALSISPPFSPCSQQQSKREHNTVEHMYNLEVTNKLTTTRFRVTHNAIIVDVIANDDKKIIASDIATLDDIQWMLEYYGDIRFMDDTYCIWWVNEKDVEEFFSKLDMLPEWKAYLKLKEFSLA